VANPTDLVKVRLQADGKANTVKRNYSGALNAYATIIRQVASTIMGIEFRWLFPFCRGPYSLHAYRKASELCGLALVQMLHAMP